MGRPVEEEWNSRKRKRSQDDALEEKNGIESMKTKVPENKKFKRLSENSLQKKEQDAVVFNQQLKSVVSSAGIHQKVETNDQSVLQVQVGELDGEAHSNALVEKNVLSIKNETSVDDFEHNGKNNEMNLIELMVEKYEKLLDENSIGKEALTFICLRNIQNVLESSREECKDEKENLERKMKKSFKKVTKSFEEKLNAAKEEIIETFHASNILDKQRKEQTISTKDNKNVSRADVYNERPCPLSCTEFDLEMKKRNERKYDIILRGTRTTGIGLREEILGILRHYVHQSVNISPNITLKGDGVVLKMDSVISKRAVLDLKMDLEKQGLYVEENFTDREIKVQNWIEKLVEKKKEEGCAAKVGYLKMFIKGHCFMWNEKEGDLLQVKEAKKRFIGDKEGEFWC